MLRAIWFLIKVAAVTALAAWLVHAPGRVEIEWHGYLIETYASVIVVAFALLLLLWTAIYRLWRAFVNVPTVFRRYKIAEKRENGYRAVTQGLVAIAAGDGVSADRYAKKAEAMIPGTPLTRLLTAQTALLNGNAPKARREFATLLEDDDAAFFGVRGLLNETLAQGDYREALTLARRADQLQPKRVWVLRTLFDLETRNRDWVKAEKTLKRAEKIGVFTRDEAARHRQAIWTGAALETAGPVAMRYCQSALAINAGFTPAAVLLAQLDEQAGTKRQAMKTIENAWRINPHPALATLWMAYMPAPKKSRTITDGARVYFDWMKQLTDLNPGHRESNRALGAAALQSRMWKEARELLLKAMDYKALAKLEREETNNEAAAREWLELASEAQPEPRWVCAACGHAANGWLALCPRCGSFDRMAWITPSLDLHAPPPRFSLPEGGLIAPP
ncbi:MAG TPA: heme biosynthesis HemY N-terminal domain-containing protein [Patescibacteria group bacterium]|nr:heme biosynthesis HemY N-terminal domain-containing protein [Patescibacteria group bacterium]